jgi:peptide/nickel transport system substrate-binding protein
MTRILRTLAAGVLLAPLFAGSGAFAQKSGGVLKVYFFDSPASMSIHEEATIAAQGPMMGVFNNLVMYRQDVSQSGLQSIVPDLATDWSWDEDKTQLTFRLRPGVKWHDGKPFTAKDVQCTWDLLTGKSAEKLRINPRKVWYKNLEKVGTNGDYEATFQLKAPATGLYCAARFRVFTRLPLPCVAARDAHAPDRHWPIQIRRIQGERVDQSN